MCKRIKITALVVDCFFPESMSSFRARAGVAAASPVSLSRQTCGDTDFRCSVATLLCDRTRATHLFPCILCGDTHSSVAALSPHGNLLIIHPSSMEKSSFVLPFKTVFYKYKQTSSSLRSSRWFTKFMPHCL